MDPMGYIYSINVLHKTLLTTADVKEKNNHVVPSGYVKIAIENGPFIVDLPIKDEGSFHSYVNVYERVSSCPCLKYI